MRFVSIGAGNIGRAWSILFAAHGWRVCLYDHSADALIEARDRIQLSLDMMVNQKFLDCADSILERIEYTSDLPAALSAADYVQESADERLSVKCDLFSLMDKLCPPDCIIASSTSGLAGSRFMEHVPGRGRCLVVHPVNPPYLIPLVELCPTPWTEPDVVERTVVLMRDLKREPILLHKEINGFVLNRLQVALISEALHLVGEGYCSVQDVDKCITHGLGLRWALMGPFETGHLNAHGGYEEYMTKFADFFREIAGELRPDYPWTGKLIEHIGRECGKKIPLEKILERQTKRDADVTALLRYLDREGAFLQKGAERSRGL